MKNQDAFLVEALKAAHTAADGASEILSKYFGNLAQVKEKFQAGLVSEADQASEKFIVETLKKIFPDHHFWGEESGLSSSPDETLKDRDDQTFWIIDPLDGTTNYIHQFPFFCISIGLEVNREIVLGLVDAPMLNMRFWATKGGGAFMNGKQIQVSSRKLLKESLFATGFSSHDSHLHQQLELVEHLIRQTRGVRRAGAAALDMCFVAQGVFDVFWERNLAPWDTAAGAIIVREAGGRVSDILGNEFDPRMKSVVAGTPAMLPELLRAYTHVSKK